MPFLGFDRQFNSEKWKRARATSQDNVRVRQRMLNDLLNEYVLVGMSKGQIIELLGDREDSVYSQEDEDRMVKWLIKNGKPQEQIDAHIQFYGESRTGRKFRYYLGPSAGYQDTLGLDIYFDDNNVVTRVEVTPG